MSISSPHCPSRVLLALVAALMALAVPAAAWPAPPVSPLQGETVVTPEEIQAVIRELEAKKDIDEGVRTKAIELRRQALRYLESAHSYEAAAVAFAQARESAPGEAEAVRQKLERPPAVQETAEKLGIGDKMPLTEIEQRLVKEQADLAALEAKLADLERQLQDAKERPALARQRLTQVKQSQEEIASQLKALPPPNEPPLVAEARRLALQMQRKAQSAEIDMLDQELLSQAARLALFEVQRDLTAHSVANVGARVALLQGIINQRRLAQAEQAKAEAVEAERRALGKHPTIGQLAERNAALTTELAELAAGLERVSGSRAVVDARAKQIEQDFQSARQRLEVAGLTEGLGRILISQRRKLPDARQYQRELQAIRKQIADAGLIQVRLDEERRSLADRDAAVDSLLAGLPPEASTPEELGEIRRELAKLVKDRRGLLDQANASVAAYLRALGDLDFAERQLLARVQAYREFLDEHLLWTPNASVVDASTAKALVGALGWFLSPRGWYQAIRVLLAQLAGASSAIALGLFAVVLLFWGSRRLKQTLHRIGDRVGKLSTDSILLTLQALLVTALLAAPGPLLLATLGWLLRRALEAPVFVVAVGQGLLITAPVLLNIEVFRRLCATDGVAQIHFRWREGTLKLLRRKLNILLAVGIPAVFVTAVAAQNTDVAIQSSLARVGFIVLMVLLAVFLEGLLNPTRGVVDQHLRDHPKGWLARLRFGWYALGVGIPLALAVLTALGYFYTAAQLSIRLVDTLWLVLGVVLVHDLVIRWLTLTGRKLALQKALERREALRAARAGAEPPISVGEAGQLPLEVAELDLEAVSAQTRKLLHTLLVLSAAVGAWLIWSPVLPALGLLDSVSVWQHAELVNGQEQLLPITLADLLLALVIGVVTAAAARNLPGVLEIAFLQRLAVEPGSRYAISSITRYVIVGAGIVMVFNAIGGSWSQIQWLVAALGVGLGFGLQEIFGNFVSGLIILFERPVRVGDTVTVGDLTGTVSRIRIRATTIVDWDRKEIVVPNKGFITERVVNWTLSDPITRIVISVGIAYGSDTTLAHKVMLDTVRSLPLVLDEPEPRVWFVGFGESSLDFRIYAFVRELGDRLPLTHELHMAVERALRGHGIQIPFPQRDIHVHHPHEDLSSPSQPPAPPYATDGAICALPAKGAGATA